MPTSSAACTKKAIGVDDKMNLLGMFPTSPLLMLATTHRTGSVRALLDAGAQVDEADDDGITVLSWAAIANRVEMARLLIQRGADVNHVDKKGMTPLLYAASIDFGDSAMIDLLLKSGAQRRRAHQGRLDGSRPGAQIQAHAFSGEPGAD